jgi:thymidylate synthase (FAD)
MAFLGSSREKVKPASIENYLKELMITRRSFVKMTDTHIKLISVTPGAEQHMAYVARVSNPNNQDNDHFAGLLKYCIKQNHWSVFEQAFMTIEINTTRGLASQILRHRAFTFQEFSQRYADTNLLDSIIAVPELRRQDSKNRQNSIDDLPQKQKENLQSKIAVHFSQAMNLYNELLQEGIAKECARFVLPLATPTRIYMTGNVRSWIHYVDLRSAHGTQKEHMDVAEGVRIIFAEQFPTVAEALEWST